MSYALLKGRERITGKTEHLVHHHDKIIEYVSNIIFAPGILPVCYIAINPSVILSGPQKMYLFTFCNIFNGNRLHIFQDIQKDYFLSGTSFLCI